MKVQIHKKFIRNRHFLTKIGLVVFSLDMIEFITQLFKQENQVLTVISFFFFKVKLKNWKFEIIGSEIDTSLLKYLFYYEIWLNL